MPYKNKKMKQLILLGFMTILVGCKQATVAQQPPAPSTTPEEVNRIMSFLASDELSGRDTGSIGLEKAAQFAEAEFTKYGLKPYFSNFLDEFQAKGVKTYNVVGYLEGTDPELAKEYVIVGAHFDHIGTAKKVANDTIANGANDNAAGSTAVLAAAKYFATTHSNKRSMLFVLFGAEEQGLLGSEHLANVLKEKQLPLYTLVNFEMIGVPLIDKSYQAYITGYKKSNMAEKINEYVGSELIGFLPKAKAFGLFRRSDNYPFYKTFKVPAQTISTFDFTNYNYYHHVDDEVEQLDFEFMANFINACIPALRRMTNTPEQEIKLYK